MLDSVTGEDNLELYRYVSGETAVHFNIPIKFRDPEVLSDAAKFSPSLKMFLYENLDAETLETLYSKPQDLYNPDGLYSKHVVLSMFPTYKKPVLKFSHWWFRNRHSIPGLPTPAHHKEIQRPGFSTQMLFYVFSASPEVLEDWFTQTTSNFDYPLAGDQPTPWGPQEATGLRFFTSKRFRYSNDPSYGPLRYPDLAGSTVFGLAYLLDLSMSEEKNRFVKYEEDPPTPAFLVRLGLYGIFNDLYWFGRSFRKDQRARQIRQQYGWMCEHDTMDYPKLHSKIPTGVEGYMQYFVDMKAEVLKKQLQHQMNVEVRTELGHLFEKYPGQSFPSQHELEKRIKKERKQKKKKMLKNPPYKKEKDNE